MRIFFFVLLSITLVITSPIYSEQLNSEPITVNERYLVYENEGVLFDKSDQRYYLLYTATDKYGRPLTAIEARDWLINLDHVKPMGCSDWQAFDMDRYIPPEDRKRLHDLGYLSEESHTDHSFWRYGKNELITEEQFYNYKANRYTTFTVKVDGKTNGVLSPQSPTKTYAVGRNKNGLQYKKLAEEIFLRNIRPSCQKKRTKFKY